MWSAAGRQVTSRPGYAGGGLTLDAGPVGLRHRELLGDGVHALSACSQSGAAEWAATSQRTLTVLLAAVCTQCPVPLSTTGRTAKCENAVYLIHCLHFGRELSLRADGIFDAAENRALGRTRGLLRHLSVKPGILHPYCT